jgi:hypothetical protein
VIGPVSGVEAHPAANVFLQQLLAGQQVVLVVLLEDPQPGGVGEGLEMDRGGIDLGGHVHELHFARPRRHVGFAHVLHQAEVAIVHGDHHITLLVAGDREGSGGRDVGDEQHARQGQRDRGLHGSLRTIDSTHFVR